MDWLQEVQRRCGLSVPTESIFVPSADSSLMQRIACLTWPNIARHDNDATGLLAGNGNNPSLYHQYRGTLVVG